MRRAAVVSIAAGALVACLSVALAWWVGQAAFLRWALDRAVIASDGRLQAEGVGGTLFDGLAIRRLRWTEPPAPGARTALSITLHELRVDASLWRLLRRELAITRASVTRVDVDLPASDAPPTLPADLVLPLSVTVEALRIGVLAVASEGAATVALDALSLRGRYRPADAADTADAADPTGTAGSGGRYTIEHLSFDSPAGRVALKATLADTAPFALDAGADVTSAWRGLPVRAQAIGTLQSFGLTVAIPAAPAAPAGPVAPVAPGAPGAAHAPGPAGTAGSARAVAQVRPFEPVPVGTVEITVAGLTGDALGLPAPWSVRIDGSARVVPARDTTGRWLAQADLDLRNGQAGRLDQNAVPLAALSGRLRWDGARVVVDRLDAVLDGRGRVRGAAAYDPAGSVEMFGRTLPRLDLDLTIDALDLAQLDARLPASRMTGTARLDGRAVDVALADAARDGARIEARARVEDGRLLIERARLGAWPGIVDGAVDVAGAIALQAPHAARLEVGFTRVDPHGLLRLPAALGLSASGAGGPDAAAPALRGMLDGTLQLDGPLRFGPDDGPVAAALTLVRGRLAGQAVSGRLRARVSPARASDVEASLLVADARLEADGALGAPGDRLRFSLRAPTVAPLVALSGRAGADGVKGALRADGTLSGRLDAPALQVQADLERLDVQGRVGARAVSLRADLPQLTGGIATASLGLRLEVRALSAGALRVDRAGLEASGTAGAHVFALTAEAPRGSLSAQGSGALSLDDASSGPRWQGVLRTLRSAGDLDVRLVEPARIDLRAGALALEQAAFTSDLGSAQIARVQWRDGRFAVNAQATVAPTRPGRMARLLEALGVTLPEARAGFDPDDLRASLRAELSGSGLADASGTLQVRMSDAGRSDAAAAADLRLDDGRLAGPLELAIPSLAFANRLIGPAWAIDGRMRFAGRVAGTLQAPRLDGTLTGSDLRLQQAAMGWRLHSGTLSGRFDGERFRLDALRLHTGQPGSGSVELTGQVRVSDREGAFTMTASRLAVPIGPGQRVVMSGQAELTSRGGAFDVKGTLRADEGLIELRGGDAPVLPADVVIAGRTTAADAAAAPGDAQRLRIAADIALELGEQLRVRGSGIDARITGRLNLRGTLPETPRAFGTVRIRDGRYSAYGQQLEITQGRIVFNGTIDNPQLDIVALRRNQTVEAGVALTGTVLSPRVRLTSQPEVPDAEKLSWLVLGVPLDSAQAGAQGAALQAAAASLFGSNDGGLAGSLAQALGLDSISVRGATGASGLTASGFGGTGFGTSLPPIPGQVGGGMSAATTGGAVGDNVVAIGKRLGSRLYVTYEQGLRGVWNLLRVQYDITERLSLRGQAGSESALDLLYRYSFD